MQQFTVEATLREDRGKNVARRMRAAGSIPAVLYGGKGESLAAQETELHWMKEMLRRQKADISHGFALVYDRFEVGLIILFEGSE